MSPGARQCCLLLPGYLHPAQPDAHKCCQAHTDAAKSDQMTGVPPLPQPARLQLSLRVSVQAATQQQPLAAHPQPQAAAAADLAATAQDAQQAGSATSPHQRPEGVREAPLDSSGISVSTDSRSPASAASTSAGSSSPEVRSESAGDARAQALPLQPTPREE
eukprot:scaffold27571_cov20-Tisochrysis_lutea.AAC.1